MITVTQTRENDRTTFCRQFTFNKNGYSNRELDGAVVSGVPVEGIEISSLPVGTKIKIPESGESFTFIKTHQGLPSPMYDPSCDGAFVLREYPVQEMPWDSQNINVYEQTDVDVWLNGDYINRFPESVKNKILTAKWPYRKNGGKNGSNQSGENGLPRKVILIGGYELGWTSATNYMFPEDGHVLDYFKGTLTIDAKRIAYANGNAVFWGTRSPQTTSTITIFGVYTNGNFSHNGGAGNMWVRPQFILSNESYVSSEPNPDGSYNLIY